MRLGARWRALSLDRTITLALLPSLDEQRRKMEQTSSEVVVRHELVLALSSVVSFAPVPQEALTASNASAI